MILLCNSSSLTPPHLIFPFLVPSNKFMTFWGRGVGKGVTIEQPSQCYHKHSVISLPAHTVRSVKSAS